MDCRDAARFVQLRLDGEIEPVDCALLDRHLENCSHCRPSVQAEFLVQTKVRAALRERADAAAPGHLRASIVQRLNEAEDRNRWPVGRAFAACVALFMVGALSWNSIPPESATMLEATVARHSRHLPPEVHADAIDEDGVNRFLQRNLRYRVAAPRFVTNVPVRLVGARLSSIRDRDVAYVMYDHRGARLSVFAFPSTAPSEPAGFERRDVGGRIVFVGQRQGYNVVSWQDRDLQYSMVGDLDPGELLQLASSAAR